MIRTEIQHFVTCEGDRCSVDSATARPSLIEFRRRLKKAGWTRRHSGDRIIDLCPTCGPGFNPPQGTRKGGRPRKARA